MNEKIDEMMFEALAPDKRVDKQIDEFLMNKNREREGKIVSFPKYQFAKTAAIFAGIILLFSTTAMAATHFLKQSYVSKYGISNDPQSVLNELMEPYEGEVPEIIQLEYEDYKEALAKLSVSSLFCEEYQMIGKAEYLENKWSDNSEAKDVIATFQYEQGTFEVNVIQYYKDGELMKDATLLVQTYGNDNIRTYTGKNGQEFTLCDSKNEQGRVGTDVGLFYEDEVGYITFYDLTEAQIQAILDTVR